MLSPHLSSAHALVKALKSPDNGLDKVELATTALQTDLYLPNKHAIVRDWILDSWRTKPEAVLNPAYHHLIQSLPRQPMDVGGFILSYVKQMHGRGFDGVACRTFRLLLEPHAAKPEVWAEAWCSLVERSNFEESPELLHFVTEEWVTERTAETRKKVATLVLSSTKALTPAKVRKDQVLDIILPHPDLYSPLLQQADGSVVPDLFRQYISLVTRARYRLFSQPSSSKQSLDAFIFDKVRASILQALRQTLEACREWQTRSRIWELVTQWGGYLETDSDWSDLVRCAARTAAAALTDEASRLPAMTILSQLEALDHNAAALGRDVVGWCLASPPTSASASEAALAAMARYHRLTKTMRDFIDLLDESCRALLEAADGYKALRATYDLIVSGPMFGARGRIDLQTASKNSAHIGLTLLNRISTMPVVDGKKRRRLRSRLFAQMMAEQQPIEGVQETLEYIGPLTTPAGDKSRQKWSADVYLAAFLRLSAFGPPSHQQPLQIGDGRTMIAEAVQELSLYSLSSGAPLLQAPVHTWFPSNLLWPLLRDGRLHVSLLRRLTAEHRIELLKNARALPAEVADMPEMRFALDEAVASLTADDEIAHLLPFASPAAQEAALRRIYATPKQLSAEVLLWTRNAIQTGRQIDEVTMRNLIRSARHCKEGLDLLETILNKHVTQDLDSTLNTFLDVLEPTKEWLECIVLLVRRLPEPTSSIPPTSREKLTSLAAALPTLSAELSRQERLIAGIAHSELVKRLGFKRDDMEPIIRALGNDTWRAREILELVRLVRSYGKLSAASIVIKASAGAPDIRPLLSDADGKELSEILAYATERLDNPKHAIPLITAILDTAREDLNPVVREHLPKLLKFLAGEIEAYPDTTMNQAIGALRHLVDRQPYAMSSREIAIVLDILLRVLSRRDSAEPIHLLLALFRHRKDILAQQAAILTDVIRAFFKRKPSNGNLVSRLLQVTAKTGATIVKHLPAILVAYTRLAASARIDPETRRALQPGLFAICDVVTSGGRADSRGREGEALGDAYGLGEGPGGEAEVWADMWTSWASKRYVGQG